MSAWYSNLPKTPTKKCTTCGTKKSYTNPFHKCKECGQFYCYDHIKRGWNPEKMTKDDEIVPVCLECFKKGYQTL
jgi:hypothetical protein